MSFPTILRPAVLLVSASVREAREQRNIGLRQLARQLDVPAGRLSALELADHIPHPPDVARILGCLGVVGAQYEQIMKLAKHVYDNNYIARHDAPSFGLTWTYEQLSDRIVEWAPSCLPDLLRPEQPFDRALSAERGGSCHAELEPLERSARQQSMRDGPCRYVFLLGEEAIRTANDQAGGEERIRHVRTAARLPNVRVLIVPTTAEVDPPPAFTLFEARHTPIAVALKHLHCTVYLTEKLLLDEYLNTAKSLRSQTFSESESTQALNDPAWGQAS